MPTTQWISFKIEKKRKVCLSSFLDIYCIKFENEGNVEKRNQRPFWWGSTHLILPSKIGELDSSPLYTLFVWVGMTLLSVQENWNKRSWKTSFPPIYMVWEKYKQEKYSVIVIYIDEFWRNLIHIRQIFGCL